MVRFKLAAICWIMCLVSGLGMGFTFGYRYAKVNPHLERACPIARIIVNGEDGFHASGGIDAYMASSENDNYVTTCYYKIEVEK